MEREREKGRGMVRGRVGDSGEGREKGRGMVRGRVGDSGEEEGEGKGEGRKYLGLLLFMGNNFSGL